MVHESQKRNLWARWASYAAAAWCAMFGGLHLYWAVGGNAGLAAFSTPSNQTAAFVRDSLYIGLTWAVALVCLYGAIVVLATRRAWGSRLPRWIVLTTLWVACGLCVVRGLGNPIQSLMLVSGIFRSEILDGPLAIAWYRWMLLDATLFSPWFTLGGLAFGVTAWSARQHGKVVTQHDLLPARQA